MSRSQNPGLSGKIYECLLEHGPLTSDELVERLGVDRVAVAGACGHLVRQDRILPLHDAAHRPIGKHGRRCHRWQAQPRDPAEKQRQVDWNAVITAEDYEWMRYYRARYERRLAKRREAECS